MREKLEEEYSRFQRSKNPFSIVVLDIDFFKKINDMYGHNFGDYVLKEISLLFKRFLRKQDVVARWGGEEFLFLLPETDLEGATIVCERIRKAIENEHVICGETRVQVTSTIGIACVKSLEDTIECAIEKADNALYLGKNEGRNRVVAIS